MENQNLNVAPTEKELIDAGLKRDTESFFNDEDCNNFVYTKEICHNLNLNIFFVNNKINEASITAGWYFVKKVKTTKAAINAEFEHFGQPLPQWEKPKPKVGEVWGLGKTAYLINDNVLKRTIRVTILKDDELDTGTIVNIISDRLIKLADTLEDYYKEKFMKNCTDWANKNDQIQSKSWCQYNP